MRIRDSLGIGEKWQRRLTRFMELSLLGMLAVGFWRGNTGIIVNTGIGVLVTRVPTVIERDFDVTLDAGLVLWITAAVWLHALGTMVLPGQAGNIYKEIWWWDHLTHALSSSVVAAAGYSTVRAIDLHSEEVHIPPRFMFVFILMFVMAFGVFWEVLEFTLSETADALGTGTILTQYDLEDTMFDLVFDSIGAVVVAIWGTVYLSDVVGSVQGWLAMRET